MKNINLANGLPSSHLGFGCMSLAPGIYKLPEDYDADKGVAIVKAAIDNGITHFDTAYVYGLGQSEEIVGRAIQGYPREKLTIATKTGLDIDWEKMLPVPNGKPEYIRQQCETALQKLQTPYIDLFYLHRIDYNVPIETTMAEMKKLVQEGKVKHIGLSEGTADDIRRAHAVHPISAVQYEYSLWTRVVEDSILPVCRELGIGLVAYSPLGRGIFAGAIKSAKDVEGDWRSTNPRFKGENLEKNLKFMQVVEDMAKQKGCTMAQLALAWVMAQGDDICPIFGTSRVENMLANVKACDVKLSKEEAKKLGDMVPAAEVAGDRYGEGMPTFEKM